LGISLLLFGIVLVQTASAHHQEQVLGASDSSSFTIPPTVEGPGFILPDSPLFFLDRFKQSARLFFAFSPERRAKIRSDIAGERLAELRLMLKKNNEKGIQTALDGVSENLQDASREVAQAQLSGRNVSELAKTINTSMKEKQATLDTLDEQAKGPMKARVRAIQEAIRHSKVTVEDSLPEADLQNEIRDELNRNVNRNIKDASGLTVDLDRDIEVLNKQASHAAAKSLLRKEEAIKKAIERKNEQLREKEEKLLEREKEKQEKLFEVRKEAIEQVRETVKKAQEAARRFQKAKQEQDSTSSDKSGSGPSVSSGSSGENKSGSGSSGSGSSGSRSSGSGKD